VPEWSAEHVYDASDNKTQTDTDHDGDGIVDRRNTMIYDARGNLIRTETDEGADGTVDQWGEWTYDADDNRIENETSQGFATLWTYDTTGCMLQQAFTWPGSTASSWTENYTCDADLNRLTKEHDYGLDGVLDQRHVWTYDANGNVLSETRDGPDGNFVDGSLDYLENRSWNADSNQTLYEVDSDGDGALDRRIEWSYDSSGSHIQTAYGLDSADAAWAIANIVLDADGNAFTEEYDQGRDGTIEGRQTYTWTTCP